MDISNFLVEVRNSALERQGVITPSSILSLEAEVPFNSVGTWTLTIAREHPLADMLGRPGAGLVVSDLVTGEPIFSGPTVQPEKARSVESPSGRLVVQGITDDTVLADRLAFPDPVNVLTAQTTAYDERVGTAEDLCHAYVTSNVGPTAESSRKHPRLLMGETQGRGKTQTVQARFETLLTLLQNIVAAENIGFRVIQRGASLYFETWEPVDQSPVMSLTFENNTVASTRFTQSAPTITRAIVGGSGGATARLFLERTNEDSLDAEEAWGRRIEVFVDQSTTRNTDEMAQAGDTSLSEGGYTGSNARIEPTDAMRESYGQIWNLGDRVAMEVDGEQYTSHVTSLIVKVDPEGLRIGCMVGDASVWSEFAALAKRFEKAEAEEEGAAGDEESEGPDLTWVEEALANNEIVLAQVQEDLDNNAIAIDQLVIDLAANDATQAQLQADLAANEQVLAQLDTDLAASAQRVSDAEARIAAAEQDISNLSTASGNAVHYETTTPGSAPGIEGDLWYQYSTAGRVIAQFVYQAGAWVSVKLENVVVATIDAGAITSGTIDAAVISVVNLNASNLTTGTIDASQIAVTNIDAGNITAGSISAARLATTQLNANNITAGVIDASKIAVVNLSASNITSGSISASRITGLTIDASQITSGQISTARLGAITIDASQITSGTIAAGRLGAITIDASQITSGTISANRISSDTLTGLTINGGTFNTIGNGTSAGFSIGTYYMQGKSSSGSTTVYGSSMEGMLYAMNYMNTAEYRVNGTARINSSGQFVGPVEAQGSLDYSNPATGSTTGGTALRIFDNNRIFKATSSLRYKRNVEDLELEVAKVLSLQPHRYEQISPDDEWHASVGFIAEEAHDAGLTDYVGYDEEGRPDSFHYDAFVTALQTVVRHQHHQINELSERLSALEAA